jgi:hypothetical protein
MRPFVMRRRSRCATVRDAATVHKVLRTALEHVDPRRVDVTHEGARACL